MVSIWQHHQLPIKHPTRASSLVIESMEEATVDSLIDASIRQWNVDTVDDIFVPGEVEIIKRIPLVRCALVDIIIWPMTLKMGNILVNMDICF